MAVTIGGSAGISMDVGSVITSATNEGTFASGTFTPNPLTGNMKYLTNAGAFTLAAPTASGDYSMVIQIVNGTGAGAVTMSGFGTVRGNAFSTTVGHAFNVHITKLNGRANAFVEALQ